MTDKQIIIVGKIKPITLEDVPTILELHKSKSFARMRDVKEKLFYSYTTTK